MIRNVTAHSGNMMVNENKKNEMYTVQNDENDVMRKETRIDELKKRIVNGDYQIDLRKTAERIAQELKPDI